MVIAQPVLERQSMEQAAVDFIAMQNVIAAVASPMDGNQLTVGAQSIGKVPRKHGQRFNIEVVTHFTEHNQVEGPSFDPRVELGSQIAAFDPNVVQTGAAASCPFNGSLRYISCQ